MDVDTTQKRPQMRDDEQPPCAYEESVKALRDLDEQLEAVKKQHRRKDDWDSLAYAPPPAMIKNRHAENLVPNESLQLICKKYDVRVFDNKYSEPESVRSGSGRFHENVYENPGRYEYGNIYETSSFDGSGEDEDDDEADAESEIEDIVSVQYKHAPRPISPIPMFLCF